jgi:serine/threonine protein kinase
MSQRIGRYEIIAPLGKGGMAEIFLSKLSGPEGFERAVVLKRMRGELLRDQDFVDMFLDEARLIASIRHPNVVQVQELGHSAGELFLAMEYLHGENVLALVRRLGESDRGIPPLLSSYIVCEAAAGLHAAHSLTDGKGQRRGVVHRDLSPDNLFVTYDGDVKVIDFGIAKASARRTKTLIGTVKGKVSYMSPEQIRGGELDHRSDIFALGIVLWELLAGKRLFKRLREDETYAAVLACKVPEIDGCPPDLMAVCRKALARDPAQRYQSAGELRRELAATYLRSGLSELPQDTLAALMQQTFAEEIGARAMLLSQAAVESTVRTVELKVDVNRLPSIKIASELLEVESSDQPVEISGDNTRPDGLGDSVGEPSSGGKTVFDQMAPEMTPRDLPSATTVPTQMLQAPARPVTPQPQDRAQPKSMAKPLPAQPQAVAKVRAVVAAPNRRTAKRQRISEETEVVGRDDDLAPPRSRGPLWAVIGLLVLGAGGGGAWWMRHHGHAMSSPSPSPSPPPSPSPAASPAPRPSPKNVTIHISTTPEGAAVRIGGDLRGTTPLELDLRRGDDAVEALIHLDGYADRATRIVPDRDRELDLPLLEAQKAAAKPPAPPRTPSSPKGAPKAKSGDFFKFD